MKYKFSKTIRPGEGTIRENGVVRPIVTTSVGMPQVPVLVNSRRTFNPGEEPVQAKRSSEFHSCVPMSKEVRRIRQKRICGKKQKRKLALLALYESLKPKTTPLTPEEIDYRRDPPAVVEARVDAEKSRGCKKNKRRKRHIGPHQSSGKSQYATEMPEGTYYIENGMPIFVKRSVTSPSEGISRSNSDVDDTWIGMGHLARDGGRFGSILGEDYSD